MVSYSRPSTSPQAHSFPPPKPTHWPPSKQTAPSRTLLPLVKQLFGSATLGGYTPANSGGQKHTGDGNPAVTIGSYPMNKRRRVSQFDTIDEPDSMSF